MPKNGRQRAQLRAILAKAERAKNNLLVLKYDIPRAKIDQERAKTAHNKARRHLERLYEGQAKWKARLEQHQQQAKDFKKFLEGGDGDD